MPAAGITAGGVGVVQVQPDLLTVRLGIETRAPQVAETLAANNERAQGLLDLLREAGVAEEDLWTSELSISPVHREDGAVREYQVRNIVTARLHDLARAGQLIDEAVRTAGDSGRIDSLAFSVADDAAARAEARRQAVEQARAHARQLADAAGVALGALRSVREGSVESPPRPVAQRAETLSAVPLAPGSQEVRVEVTIVYDVA